MQFVRIYTKLQADDAAGSTQTEVARSEPNAMPPTATYEIPPELEVTKVQVVSGYGNCDLVVTVIAMKEGEAKESYSGEA
jgi:hypothetical protein